MPGQRPKALTVDWLDRQLARLRDPAADVNTLVGDLERFVDDVKRSPSPLPANGLRMTEAVFMFGLKTDQWQPALWSLESHELFDEIPSYLTSMMHDREFVAVSHIMNEAVARSAVDNILIACIAEEKRRVMMGQQVNNPSCQEPSPRPTTPAPQPATLYLQFETKLEFPVIYNNENRILHGGAELSLWYDTQETLGTNLLVVEAKSPDAFSLAAGQLIAYMGVVCKTREALGKRNKVVYGISTDGNEVKFWRIDNESVLTSSRSYEWDCGDGREIISYIRLMVRAAVQLSPTTTPIKGNQEREVSLQAYQDPFKAAQFDYGVGVLMKDDEMEVVDREI